MKPLTIFTSAEVLEDAPSSNWVKITQGCHSPWILQFLRSKATVGAIGFEPGIIYSGLWHKVVKTHSHQLGSESIIHPSPKGRVTAGGDQQLMANTSSRVHGNCKIPAWG